jgi:hypothetical protein
VFVFVRLASWVGAFLIDHLDIAGRRNCIEADEDRSNGDIV